MATEPQAQSVLAGTGSPRSAPGALRGRIFLVVFVSSLFVIAIAAASGAIAIRWWEDSLRAEIERNLTQKADMFAAEVDSGHSGNIAGLTAQVAHAAGARATVIDMNGRVIADSEIGISALENEGRTPEFLAALRGDTGTVVRSRSAFGIAVLYVAVPVPGGAVRLAYPLADLGIASTRAWRNLALGTGVSFIAALIISFFTSRLIRPTVG